MTRTDLVLAGIKGLLESKRRFVDSDGDFSSLSVIVKFDRKTGLPGLPILRTESQSRAQRQMIRIAPDGVTPEIATMVDTPG